MDLLLKLQDLHTIAAESSYRQQLISTPHDMKVIQIMAAGLGPNADMALLAHSEAELDSECQYYERLGINEQFIDNDFATTGLIILTRTQPSAGGGLWIEVTNHGQTDLTNAWIGILYYDITHGGVVRK